MQKLIVLFKTLFMAVCAGVLFGTMAWQVHRLDRFLSVTLPPWMTVGGFVLMVAGAVLAFACFGLFSASGALSPGANFPDPEVFISWGPYRYVRNPMTKGAWTVLCGWGFYKLSPSILLFALLMAVVMHLFIVFVEEPRWSGGSGRAIGSTNAESIGGVRAVTGWGLRLTRCCSGLAPLRCASR